jgi:hypothetical protein
MSALMHNIEPCHVDFLAFIINLTLSPLRLAIIPHSPKNNQSIQSQPSVTKFPPNPKCPLLPSLQSTCAVVIVRPPRRPPHSSCPIYPTIAEERVLIFGKAPAALPAVAQTALCTSKLLACPATGVPVLSMASTRKRRLSLIKGLVL